MGFSGDNLLSAHVRLRKQSLMVTCNALLVRRGKTSDPPDWVYSARRCITGEDGLAALLSYGHAVHSHWARYQERMNA